MLAKKGKSTRRLFSLGTHPTTHPKLTPSTLDPRSDWKDAKKKVLLFQLGLQGYAKPKHLDGQKLWYGPAESTISRTEANGAGQP